MSRLNILLTLVFLCGAISSQPAIAQYPSYTPQAPMISPWMGLWNRNTGPLDNYHNFVVPQMELNQTLQMQNAALNRQAYGLQMLNGQIAQPFGSQYGMVPTGQGATFMNYSHFYGGVRQTAGVGGASQPPHPAAYPAAQTPTSGTVPFSAPATTTPAAAIPAGAPR